MAFMCEDGPQVRLYFMHCLKQSIPFLGVVYNNVCLMSFATFSCVSMRDGTKVLRVAPSIECWVSEEHKARLSTTYNMTPCHTTVTRCCQRDIRVSGMQWLVGISILALIFYVAGIPALTLGSTLYARKTDKLKDPEWLLVFGIFYREYGTSACALCKWLSHQRWMLGLQSRSTSGGTQYSLQDVSLSAFVPLSSAECPSSKRYF